MKVAAVLSLAMTLLPMAFAQSKPQVFLNHAYVVPDQATYDAVATSTFLREQFGAFESRTTVRKDMTYTGLYWYGHETYFELLQPSKDDRVPSGIAFGVEEPDGLRAMQAQGASGTIVPVTRQAEGKDVNWFYMLGIDLGVKPPSTQWFAIEYEPDFLSNWYPQFPPQKASLRREDVLVRYAAKIGKLVQRQQGLFANVTAIDLRLAPEEARAAVKLCRQIGYKLKEGSPTICTGPEVAFRIAEANSGRMGITAVDFRLTREKDGEQILQLGNSVLRFEGLRATWKF